jgi:hypothetical protein
MKPVQITILFTLVLLIGLILPTAAAGKKFSEQELKLPGKKGACFTLRQAGHKKRGTVAENMPKVEALHVSWNYSWGARHVDEQPKEIEFVPMIWGGRDPDRVRDTIETDVMPEIQSGRVKRLLGFNEPDGKDQANMTVEQALAIWPVLEATGVPLASPGPVHADREWMTAFMEGVRQKDYRVDYIAVHSYGGGNAKHFKSRMRKIYEMYDQRPLLITEFAVADWKTGGDINKNRHSPAKVLTFMKEILPWMERQDWIEGYAWFSFDIDSPQGYSSALFDKDGNLTTLGRFYRSVTPDNPDGDQNIQ